MGYYFHTTLKLFFVMARSRGQVTYSLQKADTWDMGEEANAVLPRAEPEVVAEA